MLVKRMNALATCLPKSVKDYEETVLRVSSIYGKVQYEIFEDEDNDSINYRLTISLNDLDGACVSSLCSTQADEIIPVPDKSTVVFSTAKNQHTVFANNILNYLKSVRRETNKYHESLDGLSTTFLPRSG